MASLIRPWSSIPSPFTTSLLTSNPLTMPFNTARTFTSIARYSQNPEGPKTLREAMLPKSRTAPPATAASPETPASATPLPSPALESQKPKNPKKLKKPKEARKPRQRGKYSKPPATHHPLAFRRLELGRAWEGKSEVPGELSGVVGSGGVVMRELVRFVGGERKRLIRYITEEEKEPGPEERRVRGSGRVRTGGEGAARELGTQETGSPAARHGLYAAPHRPLSTPPPLQLQLQTPSSRRVYSSSRPPSPRQR